MTDQSARIAQLEAQLASVVRLYNKHAVGAEHDYPGDAPEFLGMMCPECGGFGETKYTVEHEKSCPLHNLDPAARALLDRVEKPRWRG